MEVVVVVVVVVVMVVLPLHVLIIIPSTIATPIIKPAGILSKSVEKNLVSIWTIEIKYWAM